MGLFRRKQETLNERLLREAGLDPAGEPGEAPDPDPDPSAESEDPPFDFDPPPPVPTRRHLRTGTDEWDAVVTVRSTTLQGNQIEFTALPDGDIIVDAEKGDGDLAPLADAVEQKIDPPYKASATRHEELWAVGAKRIHVAKVELAAGDAIELTANGGAREVRVNGELSDAEVPELVQLGEQAGADYCVEAERIDGDVWEVRVSPL